MKRILTFLLCAIFIISAYKVDAQKLHLGFLAGVDFANSYLLDKPEQMKDIRQYYPMLAFNINGVVNYQSAGILGGSLEPGFIQKGGIIKSGIRTRIQLNYIQLPVLLNIKLTDKIFVSMGPEVAYLVNAKAVSKEGALKISSYYDHRTELSGLFGINYVLNTKIGLGLRYNRGFSNTIKLTYTDEYGYYKGAMKEYNQYFQVIVRYKPNW